MFEIPEINKTFHTLNNTLHIFVHYEMFNPMKQVRWFIDMINLQGQRYCCKNRVLPLLQTHTQPLEGEMRRFQTSINSSTVDKRLGFMKYKSRCVLCYHFPEALKYRTQTGANRRKYYCVYIFTTELFYEVVCTHEILFINS